MKPKRVFVGLPISPALQRTITDWSKNYRRLPVRWLELKNLHLTLIPPWYEKDVENLAGGLQEIAGLFGPFLIQFNRVTFGPSPRFPRLIWAEGPTPPQFVLLKTELEKFLPQKDQRPPRLHLTLARFRPETFSSFPIKKLDEPVNWQDQVNSVVLYESRLSPTGADYSVIKELSLKQNAPASTSKNH